MNTNVKQRQPLNGFHQRKSKGNERTHVPANRRIPTSAEVPEASKELAAALDTWHTLIQSEREQARLAAAANAKANEATADYRAKVHAALAKGNDPSKVKDETEQHKATAKAHIQFHNDAHSEREKLGHQLGLMLEAEAPSLYAPIEKRIEKSATALRGSLASVRDTWAEFSSDLEMRRWLSHVELDGGAVGAYHGASPLPREVADALAVIETHINSLDRLKSDEDQVRAFRAGATKAKSTPVYSDTYDPEARVIRRTSNAEVG